MDIYLPKVLDREYFLDLVSKVEAVKNMDIDMVKDRDTITIVIKKLGCSKFGFKESVEHQGVKYTLVEEDLAPFHKPFRSRIIEGLSEALQGIGGRVVI